ncbi:MAG TPA: DUF3551 domain-containing protein [Xanthobacteraceae bacterium]
MVPLIGAAVLAAFAASATPAAAATYPYCARYSTSGGECSFTTREQCMETLSGIGGSCTENPGYSGPIPSDSGGPYNYAPRYRRHQSAR